MDNDKMVERKQWEEFRETGLILIINQILHIFGWAIAYKINDQDEITEVYPIRTKFRGFNNDSVSKSYKKVTEYLKDNIDELHKEIKD